MNVEAARINRQPSFYDRELRDSDYSDFVNNGQYSISDAAPDPQLVENSQKTTGEKSGVARNNSRRLNRAESLGFDTPSAFGTLNDLLSEPKPKLEKNSSMCTIDLHSSEDESEFSEVPHLPVDGP